MLHFSPSLLSLLTYVTLSPLDTFVMFPFVQSHATCFVDTNTKVATGPFYRAFFPTKLTFLFIQFSQCFGFGNLLKNSIEGGVFPRTIDQKREVNKALQNFWLNWYSFQGSYYLKMKYSQKVYELYLDQFCPIIILFCFIQPNSKTHFFFVILCPIFKANWYSLQFLLLL